MIVYHGSDVIVEHPDVLHSKERLDFGAGFYTTTVQIQAERWAKRQAVMNGKRAGIVSHYPESRGCQFGFQREL